MLNWFLVIHRFFFSVCYFIPTILRFFKFQVGTPATGLASDKAVDVVVNAFSRYIQFSGLWRYFNRGILRFSGMIMISSCSMKSLGIKPSGGCTNILFCFFARSIGGGSGSFLIQSFIFPVLLCKIILPSLPGEPFEAKKRSYVIIFCEVN